MFVEISSALLPGSASSKRRGLLVLYQSIRWLWSENLCRPLNRLTSDSLNRKRDFLPGLLELAGDSTHVAAMR